MAAYGWIPPSHCTGSLTWIPCSGGCSPPHAVHAGVDLDGGPIYAGRAFHEGDLIPAKVTPNHNCAYVCWAGEEVKKYEYEVLSSPSVAWQGASNGNVPPEAIVVGETSSGERLYMGRVLHEGTLTPGKIHPSHGVLYIPYNGKEVRYSEYEVLVLT